MTQDRLYLLDGFKLSIYSVSINNYGNLRIYKLGLLIENSKNKNYGLA